MAGWKLTSDPDRFHGLSLFLSELCLPDPLLCLHVKKPPPPPPPPLLFFFSLPVAGALPGFPEFEDSVEAELRGDQRVTSYLLLKKNLKATGSGRIDLRALDDITRAIFFQDNYYYYFCCYYYFVLLQFFV